MNLCYIKFKHILKLPACFFSIFLVNAGAQAATLSFHADSAADSEVFIAPAENYISNLLEASEVFSEEPNLDNLDLTATVPGSTSDELENFLAIFEPLGELEWQANPGAMDTAREFTVLPQTKSSQISEGIYDYKIQLRSPTPSFRPKELQIGRGIVAVPDKSAFIPDISNYTGTNASNPGSDSSFLLQHDNGNKDYFIAELSNFVLTPQGELPVSPQIEFRQEVFVNYVELGNFQVSLASYGNLAPSVELPLLPGRELSRQTLAKYEQNYKTKLATQAREERLRLEQERKGQRELEKSASGLF